MKKFLAILCALVLCLMCATAMAEGESHPKYVFMFIGDGMGNPQVTATQNPYNAVNVVKLIRHKSQSSKIARYCDHAGVGEGPVAGIEVD